MQTNSLGNAGAVPQAPPSQHEGQQNGPQAANESSPSASTDDGASAAPAARWVALPAGLRERRQWVLAGHDKRPLTVTGGFASATDPATWTTFDEACAAAQARGLDLGYVLHESDPFACIDLDVKDDTDPRVIAGYQNVIDAFDSYTERSRSGRGFHVWVEGKVGAGRRREGVEVYSQERYIICTGDVVLDRPITARPQQLAELLDMMGGGRPSDTEIPDGEEVESDATVCELAMCGSHAATFLKLCNGDWTGYPSQSEADFELMRILASHSPSNAQVRRLFRMSQLGKRDKATRDDKYLNRTLRAVRNLLANDRAQVAHGRQLADAMFWREPLHDPSLFRLLTDDDLRRLPPQRWLVKGIVPAASVGTIFGQSGTFKSFLALDLLAHVANGQPWFGYRVKAAPAVYVPFEGKGGIPKRVTAWCTAKSRQAECAVATRMAFITEPMNLRAQADRDKLVATLTASGWVGGMLCIDTLAQAGAGIDENGSEGMGEMIAIFQELQHRIGGAVLVIHHSGKVQSAGMRGWSGLRGALDFAIECQKPDDAGVLDARFKLDKVKDEEEGKVVPFSMLRVHLGYDEDGDPVSAYSGRS